MDGLTPQSTFVGGKVYMDDAPGESTLVVKYDSNGSVLHTKILSQTPVINSFTFGYSYAKLFYLASDDGGFNIVGLEATDLSYTLQNFIGDYVWKTQIWRIIVDSVNSRIYFYSSNINSPFQGIIGYSKYVPL